MTSHPASYPLDPIHDEMAGVEPQLIQILARRVLNELLDPSRRTQKGANCLGDPSLQFEQPSVTEMLTIHRCGYPRAYHLNDGMGPDMALPVPAHGRSVAHILLNLKRLAS
jgi:hypothetical protein